MDQLSNFLNKYKRLVKDDFDLKSIILQILKDNKISISVEKIRIQGENLYLNCNPVFKTEVFIKKEKILEEINSKQTQYKLKDIRF